MVGEDAWICEGEERRAELVGLELELSALDCPMRSFEFVGEATYVGLSEFLSELFKIFSSSGSCRLLSNGLVPPLPISSSSSL